MKGISIAIAFLLATLSLLVIVVGTTILLYVADRLDQALSPIPKEVIYHTSSNTEFLLRDGMVSVPTELQQCVDDNDCAVVPNHCGNCLCGEEINRNYMTNYSENYTSLCDIYFRTDEVIMCRVYCKPRQAKCVEGICSS